MWGHNLLYLFSNVAVVLAPLIVWYVIFPWFVIFHHHIQNFCVCSVHVVCFVCISFILVGIFLPEFYTLSWEYDRISFFLFFFSFLFFFYSYFIYLFIFIFWLCWVFGSCEGFLWLRQVGATLHRGAGTALHRGARAFHYRGPSHCGAQAPDAQAQ